MTPQTPPRAVSESVARCRPVGFISTPARRRARALREPAWTCGIGLEILSPTYLQSNRSNRGNMSVRDRVVSRQLSGGPVDDDRFVRPPRARDRGHAERLRPGRGAAGSSRVAADDPGAPAAAGRLSRAGHPGDLHEVRGGT